MKKIPTMFVRTFDGHKIIGVDNELLDPSFQCILDGEGIATIKYDGACCAVIDGKFYKRFDAKKGKKIPEGAIPCEDKPDPITGHWPHWVAVDEDNPADKWFIKAYYQRCFVDGTISLEDGTYEAMGPHFQGNPSYFSWDILVKHGSRVIQVDRTFEGIRDYLKNHEIEGIVFWKDDKPLCKIKRSDFGFEWPVK